MAPEEHPVDDQLGANLDFIRSFKDRQYVIDVLTARRDFLRLRRREELAVRAVYIRAADQVAAVLRQLQPTIGALTRNHLVALERSLRREADAIQQALESRIKEGMAEAAALAAKPLDNQLVRAIQAAQVPVDIVKLQRGFADINRAAVEALWARTRHGVRVSDRIWKASQNARDGMRNLIQVGLAAGRDAVQVSRDLERYVRHGIGTLAGDYPNMMRRMGRRIPKNLSYEALRLVRSEYTKAFTEGTYSRGRANPGYRGVKWLLSDSHPVPDICDELATRDLYGMGPGVYPRGEEPVNPHPNCLCSTVPVLVETEDFVEDLIAWRQNPSSKPYLEEWYNEFVRGVAA